MRTSPVRRALAGLALSLAPPAAASAQEPVDFAHGVAPLFKARCAECHADGKSKGDFSIDTRETMLRTEGAVVPGKASASGMIGRLTSDDPEERMPPKGERLTKAEVDRLRAWIDQGARWEPGFTFKGRSYVAPLKPRRPELPPAIGGVDHPIDRLVAAHLAKNNSSATGPADDAAFARRLFLDAVGLLPPPDELRAFVDDKAADKRDRLIRRVLDDDRAYADHWLTFWNDLLRNDYAGTGYIDGGRKPITAWLYQALLDNKPYDAFTRELVSPSPGSEGFADGIKWRGRVNASQVREVQFSQNVSQVFFGVNMKCASCHDSFIDGWKLDDAYGLAAVIADAPLEVARCDVATGRVATPKFLWPELGSIDGSKPKAERLKDLAALVTHPENGRYARTIVNRVWQRLLGRGIVYPVDVMANEPWSADLLDHLATYLVDQKYDLKALLAYILTSRAYQSRPSLRSGESSTDGYVFGGPELKRMTAEQFVDAVWFVTGTSPAKADAPLKFSAEAAAPGHRFVRASLVKCDPLMRSLGRPNREQVVTVRGDTLTTLQALDLSNGQSFADLIAKGAAALRKENAAATADDLAAVVYGRALGREPTPPERATARDLIGDPATDDGLADLLWSVFMLPEFQLIR